jgi:endonuclease-3
MVLLARKASEVHAVLRQKYPRARMALDFENPWESLVATILSAQCTDARVNSVTPVLFKKYKSVAELAKADRKGLEAVIRSTGFYRNKAKHIIGAARTILADFKGEVPQSMQELLTLPGVARKTANVVLGNAFGRNEGVAVDTHVRRVSRRLGLTESNDPVKIEQDLMRALDKKEWGDFSLRVIAHGRETCAARKPRCGACVLASLCPSKGSYG